MSPDTVLDPLLIDAIDNIADGAPVDWRRLDQADAPGANREWGRCLRILEDIALLHRELPPFEEGASESRTMPATVRVAGVGDNWGRYTLTQKIGEGGFGSVYRAWDSELERDVAIKILHRQVADTRLKERLLREGRALAKVRHPNVVSVLGVESHEDRVGLCMEFVRGETLANVVHRQGRLSAGEAALIGEDLCRALIAVHRAGFIHRDVKARNVMREEAGRIVLMDFGTGRTADDAPPQGDMAGTPLYMAPELFREEPASAASDVYSLGVLLYHLVTGAYPVEGRTIDEFRAAHAARQRKLLAERRPDLPAGFVRTVEKALADDPKERYANAAELYQALGGVNSAAAIRRRLLTRVVAAIAIGVLGMIALGAITSIALNLTMQRSGFADESPLDWLVWGRRTSFTPVLVVVALFIVATVLAVLRKILLTIGVVNRLDGSIRRGLGVSAARLRLDDASILAGYALLFSAAAVVVAAWLFLPLIAAVLSYAPTAAREDLEVLSPAFVGYHNLYRQAFIVVVTVALLAWYPVWRLARSGQGIHKGLFAGGVLVIGVALVLLHAPYRLLYFNKVFDAVDWKGTRCYDIGERGDDVLLFCPEMPPPRNRIVKRGDSEMRPTGISESIFTRFGTAPPGSPQ